MHFYEYKGFIIYPTPRLVLEPKYWTVDLTIRRGDKIKAFHTEHVFPTKGEAAFHCINFGKRIIDGEIGSCTIDDLL
jgi:hypothetical protein